jgi:hypothetical protein
MRVMQCINKGLEELRGWFYVHTMIVHCLLLLRKAILSLYSGFSVGCEDQPCSWVRREGRERER